MARSALKIGVRDLAAMAGVTTATITRYENERGGLNAVTRDKIAAALENAGVLFIKDGRGDGVIKLSEHAMARAESEQK
ncbi:LacI family DNA-binding transcriptional regulator [Rhizobium grahamii]|uniref:LacI family DNA-binding transcriptional regulator n=2 Tax=Rhizobium/Agrobacterium group TaxID=227290 RepID=A0A5Q0CAA7_9HYPH|nr:LacI family DNA-binding transcriptional regulator [Rhizobium grahamii]QRM51420.1 LacI family DNA-binding transcriptional regulator [Rhizobium sp. BG6]